MQNNLDTLIMQYFQKANPYCKASKMNAFVCLERAPGEGGSNGPVMGQASCLNWPLGPNLE